MSAAPAEAAQARGSAPLVSLVTPTHNQARYLAAAIESVLAQTYSPIEYIVIDDGSTDNTVDVLRIFGDRVSWKSQANVGQARTLNNGWSIARGDIIGYLSSDDLLKPDAIAAAVAALAGNPTAVACYCDFDLIDEFGRRIRALRTENYSRKRLVGDLVCLPGPGAFFTRRALDLAGGWNPDLRQIPDFDFWLRLSRHGTFVRIPENLAAYRIHPDSASFRPTTVQRSDEIVSAVTNYWRGESPVDASEARASLAMAHIIAARSHFISGRLAKGIVGVTRAWQLTPSRGLQPLTWRILAGGLVRRVYYILRNIGRVSSE